MAITFDPEKNQRNIAERGLSFELATEIDWQAAYIREDTRRDYRETRFFVLAMIHDRLHALVITPRGEDIRVISLRKANRKEQILYDRQKAQRQDPGQNPEPRTH